MKLSDYRREYVLSGLQSEAMLADPHRQFELWFQQAEAAGVPDFNALSLATTSAAGVPSVRTVLLKEFGPDGYVFYTNYSSRKGDDLAHNPRAALLFPWLSLERQIRLEGRIERVDAEQSGAYFASRPRGSQLGAWASHQSQAIASRAELQEKMKRLEEKFADGPVPLPPFWGGYRLLPDCMEFWQGRANRLHDRFEYRLAQDGAWRMQRLSP